MAQRDYVKKKTKTKKNSSRIIPNLMMAIAIILVIMFVAILYIVSTNKSNKPTIPPQAQTQKPETTLPEKPQERWTYLKELENPDSVNGSSTPSSNNMSSTPNTAAHQERQQILDHFINDGATHTAQTTTSAAQNNTPVTQQQTLPSSANNQDKWFLQCGAFKDLVNAQSLRAKIAMSGVISEINSATYHRVIAGPFASKSKAENTLTTLKNNGVTTCIISSK